MEQTTEQKVAKTILQRPIGTLTIDGATYEIPAPTTATLIAISGLISYLPEFDTNQSDDELVAAMLEKAKDCRPLGQIAATLILGAKRIKEEKRKWWQFWKSRHPLEIDMLTDRILDNCTAGQLRELVFDIFKEAEFVDFFVLTTSLRTKNILTPTREVGKTTASGD